MSNNIPRIYTSFDEFARDERRRRLLPPRSAPVSADPASADPASAARINAAPASVAPALEHPVLVSAAPASAAPAQAHPVLVAVSPALPVLPPIMSLVPSPSRSTVTPTSLRAESILEIGRAQGTSVLFVRTSVKLHLLHSTWLPDRQLDGYAVSLAVTWIEDHGLPSCTVAKNLGVSETTLRKALTKAGYERLSPQQHTALAGARAARKLGNRRGRLVHAPIATSTNAARVSRP